MISTLNVQRDLREAWRAPRTTSTFCPLSISRSYCSCSYVSSASDVLSCGRRGRLGLWSSTEEAEEAIRVEPPDLHVQVQVFHCVLDNGDLVQLLRESMPLLDTSRDFPFEANDLVMVCFFRPLQVT